MASSFKNASVTISAINTDTTFYTASSVLSAVIHGLYIANKHATANVQVTLKVIDSSESNAERVILHKVPIPPNTTMSLDKPINLEFWLNFPQICCNLRGPANYWGCPDDCFPTANGSQGPVLEHLKEIYDIDGQSLIKVNITESSPIKGGGGKYFHQGFHN